MILDLKKKKKRKNAKLNYKLRSCLNPSFCSSPNAFMCITVIIITIVQKDSFGCRTQFYLSISTTYVNVKTFFHILPRFSNIKSTETPRAATTYHHKTKNTSTLGASLTCHPVYRQSRTFKYFTSGMFVTEFNCESHTPQCRRKVSALNQKHTRLLLVIKQ